MTLMKVILTFHECTERLPDDEMLVLMALADGDVYPGFQDSGEWRFSDAMSVTIEVTHWADMPEHPNALASIARAHVDVSAQSAIAVCGELEDGA